MVKIMALKDWLMRLGLIVIGSCICFSVMKACTIYEEVKELSQAQKEMNEFLETWRRAV